MDNYTHYYAVIMDLDATPFEGFACAVWSFLRLLL